MKRFTSFLCVLCLVVGTMTGLTFAPSRIVKAADEVPGKVTVAYFADQKFTQYASLTEISVATGSAIGVQNATEVTVGGKSQWTHGIVIAEPESGWIVEGAEYGNESDSEKEALAFSTLKNAADSVAANTQEGTYTPDTIKTLLDSYPDKEAVKAIYINRAQYEKMQYRTLYVYFKNTTTEQVKPVTVKINTDHTFVNPTVQQGDTFDVFDMLPAGAMDGYVKTDFTIEHYGINATPNSALKELFDVDDYMTDADYGKYEVMLPGQNSLELTNKKSGVAYEVYLALTPSGNSPLNISSFTVGSDSRIENDNNQGLDLGRYYIYPEGKNYLTEVTLSFTLPDGTTLNDVAFANRSVKGAASTSVEFNSEGFDKSFTVTYSESGSDVTVKVTSDVPNQAVTNRIYLSVIKESTVYDYTFGIEYNRPIQMGGMGAQLLPIAVGNELNLVDFLYIGSNDIQKFYDGITNGDYTIEMGAVKPLFENGEFKGKLIAYGPCERMAIFDATWGETLYSGSSEIKAMLTTAVEAGQTVDIKKLLGGYWNGNDVTVTPASNYTLDDSTGIFTAPQTVDTITSYIVKGKYFEIKIKVCPAGSLMESLSEIVTEVQKDENLIVDVSDKDASVSAETINNFEEKGGANSSFILKITSNGHTPEWHFNKNDLTQSAGGKIDLTIEVGDELKNTVLDALMAKNNVSGVKVGFAKNGKLPGKTGIRIYLSDEEVKQLGNKNKVSLYFFDESGVLQLEAKNCYVVKDINGKYYIDFPVTHNSDFVLSSSEEESYGEAPVVESTVTFMNGETVVSTKKAAEGTTIEKPADPTKAEDDKYTYTFKGWSTDKTTVAAVAEKYGKDDITYYAVFEATEKQNSSSGSDSGSGSGSGSDSGSGSGSGWVDSGSTDTTGDTGSTGTTGNTGSTGTTDTTPGKTDTTTTVKEVVENKDGSTTTTEVTENKNGSTTTKTSVTDAEGNVLAETVKEESVNKKGTTIEETSTVNADGSSEYSVVKTTKGGKVITLNVTVDTKGNESIVEEIVRPDGSVTAKKYDISESGEIKVVSIKTNVNIAEIPATVEIDGETHVVDTIGKKALAGNKDVEYLTIGKNITTISKAAFKNASNLKSIVIKGDGLEAVGKDAFKGIAEDAVIKIKASKKEYKRILALIKASGISDTVKFKRAK